jgi:hypothetical protein
MKINKRTILLPNEVNEIIFLTNKHDCVFIGRNYGNSILGYNSELIEQTFNHEDIIWWFYSHELKNETTSDTGISK